MASNAPSSAWSGSALYQKEDRQRLGVEGALGGAAVGILLLFLLDEAAAAQAMPGMQRWRGPLGFGESEGGSGLPFAGRGIPRTTLPPFSGGHAGGDADPQGLTGAEADGWDGSSADDRRLPQAGAGANRFGGGRLGSPGPGGVPMSAAGSGFSVPGGGVGGSSSGTPPGGGGLPDGDQGGGGSGGGVIPGPGSGPDPDAGGPDGGGGGGGGGGGFPPPDGPGGGGDGGGDGGGGGGGGGGGNGPGEPTIIRRRTDPPPEFQFDNVVPSPLPAPQQPEALLVIVRTEPQVMAQSLNQTATAENSGRQVGVEFSVLGVSGPLDTVQVVSERLLTTLATTPDQTSTLVQDLQNIGLDHSQLVMGGGSNVLQVSVADVVRVVQEAGAELVTDLELLQAAVRDSVISVGEQSDWIDLEVGCNLLFDGVQQVAGGLNQSFVLESYGLHHSDSTTQAVLDLGGGDNQLSVDVGLMRFIPGQAPISFTYGVPGSTEQIQEAVVMEAAAAVIAEEAAAGGSVVEVAPEVVVGANVAAAVAVESAVVAGVAAVVEEQAAVAMPEPVVLASPTSAEAVVMDAAAAVAEEAAAGGSVVEVAPEVVVGANVSAAVAVESAVVAGAAAVVEEQAAVAMPEPVVLVAPTSAEAVVMDAAAAVAEEAAAGRSVVEVAPEVVVGANVSAAVAVESAVVAGVAAVVEEQAAVAMPEPVVLASPTSAEAVVMDAAAVIAEEAAAGGSVVEVAPEVVVGANVSAAVAVESAAVAGAGAAAVVEEQAAVAMPEPVVLVAPTSAEAVVMDAAAAVAEEAAAGRSVVEVAPEVVVGANVSAAVAVESAVVAGVAAVVEEQAAVAMPEPVVLAAPTSAEAVVMDAAAAVAEEAGAAGAASEPATSAVTAEPQPPNQQVVVSDPMVAAPAITSSMVMAAIPAPSVSIAPTLNQPASFKFTATVVGIDNYAIESGDGADRVSVQAVVPDNLDAAITALLKEQGIANPEIHVESRALRKTTLNVAGGDDQVRLLGGMRDSGVDLGAGNDRLQLTGAFDESWIRAGFGDDVVLLGGSGDLTGWLSGGEGVDRLGFEARTKGVDVRLERDWVLDLPNRAKDGFELDADDWEDALEDVLTIDGFEIVVGSGKADVLSANASDLLLQGGAGDDWLLINMASPRDPFDANSLLVHGGLGRDTYLFHGWEQPGYTWSNNPVHLDISVLELREGKERLATANGRGDVSLLSVASNRGDAPFGTTLLPIDTIENLLAGIAEPEQNRLAIASSLGEGGMLVMLGDQMPLRYAPVATFRFDQEDLVVWNR